MSTQIKDRYLVLKTKYEKQSLRLMQLKNEKNTREARNILLDILEIESLLKLHCDILDIPFEKINTGG